MANIFQNFGSKVGNAFTNLGQGNSVLANQSQIANLSDEDKNKLRKQGLQKFADTMFLTSAIGSGDANKIALAQNRIRQRQLDEEDAKRKVEQQEAIEKYKKDNPDKADIIDAILGGVPASVAIPKTPPKKSKSDYIVEIFEKIKADPTYGTADKPFSTSDQSIIDLYANTDEFTKLKRQYNQMVGNEMFGGINTEPNTELPTNINKPQNFKGTIEQWEKLKEVNPDVSDQELIDYYNENYGT